MKFFITNIMFSLMVVLASCNSKKEVVITKEDSKQIESNLIKEGYVIATVVHNKNSLCEYTIVDKKTELKFDPINIDNEQFNAFKVDGKDIIIKYRLLRRANRCEYMQPIEIEDIQNK